MKTKTEEEKLAKEKKEIDIEQEVERLGHMGFSNQRVLEAAQKLETERQRGDDQLTQKLLDQQLNATEWCEVMDVITINIVIQPEEDEDDDPQSQEHDESQNEEATEGKNEDEERSEEEDEEQQAIAGKAGEKRRRVWEMSGGGIWRKRNREEEEQGKQENNSKNKSTYNNYF